jgi:hypothetical protein
MTLIAPKLTVLAGLTLALPLLASTASAGTAPAPVAVPFSALHASSTTVGGATVLPTTRTVPHWFGTALNLHNGVTYGFTMVGADPALETSTTITADIVPVTVIIGGQAFRGSDVVQPVLGSPVFTANDYSLAPLATGADGGALSGGNTNNQLEDATMRSQFGKQGTGYHLLLHPVVHAPVTIVVPAGRQGHAPADPGRGRGRRRHLPVVGVPDPEAERQPGLHRPGPPAGLSDQ